MCPSTGKPHVAARRKTAIWIRLGRNRKQVEDSKINIVNIQPFQKPRQRRQVRILDYQIPKQHRHEAEQQIDSRTSQSNQSHAALRSS